MSTPNLKKVVSPETWTTNEDWYSTNRSSGKDLHDRGVNRTGGDVCFNHLRCELELSSI